MTQTNNRQSEYPVDEIFLDRWSPRAFTGEAMPEEDLLTLIDAAHWAPSASNNQPWRFLYALRDSAHWEKFLNQLVEFNQMWAKNASALIFVISRTHTGELGSEDQKAIYSHSFDAGTASGMLALQARMSGYYAHGMTGIHFHQAPGDLGIPDGFRLEAAIAVGKLADKSTLPEKLQEREIPSSRKPVSEIAFNGVFVAK